MPISTDMGTMDSKTVEEMRARLASRPSFFGGTVSTRIQSAAPGWTPPALQRMAPAGRQPGSAGSKGNSRAAETVPSRPQPDRQQDRRKMARDFGGLDDDDALPGSPQNMPKPGDRAIAALASVQKRKQQAGRSRAPTPPAAIAAPNGHARRAKVVLPKGKAGSYGRLRAVAPQGVGGLTPRQKDDRAMMQKAAERRRMREALGSSGGKRPAAEDGLEDFIEDDSEESNSLEDSRGDWRSAMRSVTGYDPDRYGNVGDDRSMVASRAQIEAEERRSLRAGRAEDERDAEAEARARSAKAAKKERARKRPKAGGAQLFMA